MAVQQFTPIDTTMRGHPRQEGSLGLIRTGYGLLALGGLVFVVGASGMFHCVPLLYSLLSLGAAAVGALLVMLPGRRLRPPGIQNDGIMVSGMTSRGVAAWVAGVAITGFYVLLYWFPATLEHAVFAAEPLSRLLRGEAADRWFLYGTLYTGAVLFMGVRMLIRYRHSRYQLLRTLSLMFFQSVFAFVLPSLLRMFDQPEFYFTYFWPLKYEYLFPSSLKSLLSSSSTLTVFMGYWTVAISLVGVPVLTYAFGKRWYCSWVCGCGGLAETLGDPFRHLSDTSLSVWKFERWMIHGVLLFILLTTALLWINSWLQGSLLGSFSSGFARVYGFLIGAMFSGVIGVGFYPLLGSRVWCRFGCPLAAVLGIFQKYASRFRITVNGDQCISCGNCSTYCEMGIDVRAYAQRGTNIVRASCVGCGICSAVCPRGVLNLENGPVSGRIGGRGTPEEEQTRPPVTHAD